MSRARSRPWHVREIPEGEEGHTEIPSITSISAMLGSGSTSTSTSTSTPASEPKDPVDMLSREKEKPQPTLELVVANDVLCLKGPGTGVDPALLSGNVVLSLPEATPIKEITLSFRGKVRLPPSYDS
jgi:hypothetical protein